jgi:hypothetical protein
MIVALDFTTVGGSLFVTSEEVNERPEGASEHSGKSNFSESLMIGTPSPYPWRFDPSRTTLA